MKTKLKAEDELAELLASLLADSLKSCLAVSHLSAPHMIPHGNQRCEGRRDG